MKRSTHKGAQLAKFALGMFAVGCGGTGGPDGGSSNGICSADLYTPNYNSSISQKRWSSLPINVYFESSTASGATTVEERCRQGFDEWEAALGVNLWQEVTNPAAANLRVRVETVAPQQTLGITTIYFFQGETTIQRAEMVIYAWSSLPPGSYAGTATHELGHAFGINGHSPSSADIMYFTGNSNDLLTTSDLNTVRTLYCNFGTNGKILPSTRSKADLVSQTFTCPLSHQH
jgi:hypothetical protein